MERPAENTDFILAAHIFRQCVDSEVAVGYAGGVGHCAVDRCQHSLGKENIQEDNQEYDDDQRNERQSMPKGGDCLINQLGRGPCVQYAYNAS